LLLTGQLESLNAGRELPVRICTPTFVASSERRSSCREDKDEASLGLCDFVDANFGVE
jgi:hypothetical protein